LEVDLVPKRKNSWAFLFGKDIIDKKQGNKIQITNKTQISIINNQTVGDGFADKSDGYVLSINDSESSSE